MKFKRLLTMLLSTLLLASMLVVASPVTAQASTGVTPMVYCGYNHTIALKDDGTVWTWGRNNLGQLGDGTNTDRLIPTQVLNLNNVIKISAKGGNTCAALDSNGVVWTWGNNYYGQLGDGTTINRNQPTQVISGVKDISIGGFHTLALKTDGTVWAWGHNNTGELGDGTNVDKQSPVQVLGLTNIIAVSVGMHHSIALKSDGTVWAWGHNSYGQLGNNSTLSSNVPVQMNISNVAQISASGYGEYSLLLKADNTAWGCGKSIYGQLGTGSASNVNKIPVQYGSYNSVRSVSGGSQHSVVLLDNGTVQASGWNNYGQLGDGNGGAASNKSYVAVTVSTINNVTSIGSGASQSAAVKSDGTVWMWGKNNYGQLGNGTTTNGLTPVQVPDFNLFTIQSVVQIECGYSHTLALKEDGTVWAWGRNNLGQLGNGTYNDSLVPVQVTGLNNIIKISSKGSFSCLALDINGVVWAWGRNYYGQLGDGTTINKNIPIQIFNGAKDISISNFHTLILMNDGTVWSCGHNYSGQLGDGTYVDKKNHVQVMGLNNIKTISAGMHHSLALKNDGTVWGWGHNSYGQLGDNSTLWRNTPVQMLVSNVKSIDACGNGSHSLLLKNDGTAWGCGHNANGQLGNGTQSNSKVPIQITNFNNNVSIAGGSTHSLLLKNDGITLSSGWNYYGQLGDGNGGGANSRSLVPIEVDIDAVENIYTGENHCVAIKEDGTLWAWGWNNYGQLGDGTKVNRFTPVQVQFP